MAAYDFTAPRLYLDADFASGISLPLDRSQANYLLNVLRRAAGDRVLVFNGRDGEWLAAIGLSGRRDAHLDLVERTRAQTAPYDLVYLFAPLKSARLDYLAQKAVEMGAGVIAPVLTRRTQGERLKVERLRANAIEAAEQCGILSLPEIRAPQRFDAALAALEPGRLLVFCDEDAPAGGPVAALGGAEAAGGVAVLIGPEGGFAPEERDALLARPNTLRLSLGPRILRADTAAVAALALVQAVRGDWR
jgi:16S rRNA (uracil1498-N3)-methyltransferase